MIVNVDEMESCTSLQEYSQLSVSDAQVEVTVWIVLYPTMSFTEMTAVDFALRNFQRMAKGGRGNGGRRVWEQNVAQDVSAK